MIFARNIKSGYESDGLGIASVFLLMAVILGVAASVLPTLIFVGIVIATGAAVYSAKNPYIGLIFALALVFEVIPDQFQPGLPVAGGKLKPYDVLIVYLAALVWIRSIGTNQSVWAAIGASRWPLMYLYGAIGVSLLYVRYFAKNPMAMGEARSAMVWLLIPLIALGVDTRARFKGLVIGAILIGLVISLYVSLESLLHLRIMTGARVEPLDARSNSDVTRSLAGGGTYVIIFALLLIVNAALQGRISMLVAIPTGLLLSMGIAVQYGRGAWIGTAFGLMISAAIYRGISGLVRVIAGATLLVCLLLTVISFAQPRAAEAMIDRAAGIGQEFSKGGSFGFRMMENRHAIAAIAKHPWLGVGIGADYKPTMSVVGYFPDETRYIHNSYLWFPLKLGLWASLIPFAFVLAFCYIVKQGWAKHHGQITENRALLGAVSGAFLVPLITSYTQPEWLGAPGISAYSLFFGIALLYLRYGDPFTKAGPVNE